MVYATIRQHGDAVTTEKTTEKILSLISENPNITTEELARVCDMTPDGVYYHTKRLREKGVLIREGGRVEHVGLYRPAVEDLRQDFPPRHSEGYLRQDAHSHARPLRASCRTFLQ